MESTSTSVSGNRLVWLDVVRFVAMFAVVCCHSTDPFNFYPGDSPQIGEIKFWGAAYGALLRPCVPLFVMITGALLLPVREESGLFYRKRISRVLWPFLLWSVLYALFPWIVGVLGFPPSVILDFFPYSGEEATRQALGVSMGYIASIPLNFSPVAVHLWYIYLLIGLYLYLPIFSAWVERASERAKRWFLIAWLATLFVPYLREAVTPYLWGACSWNEFGMLYYFAGFNGYLLLGHYLRHHYEEVRHGWMPAVLAIMFLVGYAITFFGFRWMSAMPDCTPEQLELFFYYCSPNVAMMTVPVFLWAKGLRFCQQVGWIRAMLANLTLCGFGVYMVHFFFTGPSVLLVRAIGVPIFLQIPAAALIAFAASWIITLVLRRLFGGWARYVVG